MTIALPVVTMETHPHPNKKFMSRFERYEPVVLDHTAMIAAKTCFRKYFYQIVLGRVTKEEAIYFAWGSSYHKFRHLLELEYGIGDNRPPKFDFDKAMDAFTIATNAAMDYWRKHGKDQDTESKYSFMTQARLMKSFKVAFTHWSKEKQQGAIEVLQVEQPFNIQMADGSYRAGRADQIVRWVSKIWGRDFKTSSKNSAFYERYLDPNEQFTGYTWSEAQLAGERVQGQLVELLYNEKPTKYKENGPEIIPLVASRTDYQLNMWEKEHIFYAKLIAECREADTWPMQEVSCPFCPYHNVCKQGSEASQMYQLETQFNVRPWDHTKVGHDL